MSPYIFTYSKYDSSPNYFTLKQFPSQVLHFTKLRHHFLWVIYHLYIVQGWQTLPLAFTYACSSSLFLKIQNLWVLSIKKRLPTWDLVSVHKWAFQDFTPFITYLGLKVCAFISMFVFFFRINSHPTILIPNI